MKSLDIHPYYNKLGSISIFAYREVIFTVAALDLDLDSDIEFKIRRTIRRN